VDANGALFGYAPGLVLTHSHRWQRPTGGYITCEPESRELLALCLKKIRGLNKVKLADAVFIWTEPHSMRLKVKIKIQKEVEMFTSGRI
jgi:nonsense-mediated mRNA decay protein 3